MSLHGSDSGTAAAGAEAAPAQGKGKLAFEPGARNVRWRGVTSQLSVLEHGTLALMAAHPGEMISRETFYREVWGQSLPAVETGRVCVYISRLRKKLPGIQIIPGRNGSYMLPASELEDPAGSPDTGLDDSVRLYTLVKGRQAWLHLLSLCSDEERAPEVTAALQQVGCLVSGGLKQLSRRERWEPQREPVHLLPLIQTQWDALASLAEGHVTLCLAMPEEPRRPLLSKTPPVPPPSMVLSSQEVLEAAMSTIMSRVILHSPGGTELYIIGRESPATLELEFQANSPARSGDPPLADAIADSTGMSLLSLPEETALIDDLLNLAGIKFRRHNEDNQDSLILELPRLGAVKGFRAPR